MSDCQANRRADRWAQKYRWLVWGFWPAAFVAAAFVPWREIGEALAALHWWSFG